MSAQTQERRSTAEAVNAPLRLASGASPMLSAENNDSRTRVLRATVDVFIARYREFLTVDEHEQPAFDDAHEAFRAAAHHVAVVLGPQCTVCGTFERCSEAHEHQAALTESIRAYGMVALDWMRPAPRLTLHTTVDLLMRDTCECGNAKKVGVQCCLECSDVVFGAVSFDITGPEVES